MNSGTEMYKKKYLKYKMKYLLLQKGGFAAIKEIYKNSYSNEEKEICGENEDEICNKYKKEIKDCPRTFFIEGRKTKRQECIKIIKNKVENERDEKKNKEKIIDKIKWLETQKMIINQNKNVAISTNFAQQVKKSADRVDEEIFKKWDTAYNLANELELKLPDNTFLFSAQHKDCVILATVLTALNNSDTLIWRTDDVADLSIDKVYDREHDINAVNMSASLSLIDWEDWESANSFLINGSRSNVNNGSCEKLLQSINNESIKNIIKKYYNILEPRYLCVYEFNDEQLIRYVRLSKSWGKLVDDESKIKEKIQTIKKNYLENNGYSQNIQSRILTTTPSSINPYITHILEPNNNNYSLMKNDIIQYIINSEKSKLRFL